MTLTPGDDLNEISRQRTRDQFGLLEEAHGKSIIVDSGDAADFSFICSSEHVLVAPFDPDVADEEDAVTRLTAYLTDTRAGEFEPVPAQPEQPRTGLTRRFDLPARTVPVPDGKDLLATLAEIDRDMGIGFATPDHLVHICGRGLICPATEPTETGFPAPWPRAPIGGAAAGHDVDVVVIDTGYDPAENAPNPQGIPPWPWLEDVTGRPEPHGLREQGTDLLHAYAGHGTFVAGVIRAIAPDCNVDVLNLAIDENVPGGGVLESDLVDRLYDALGLETWLPGQPLEEKPKKLPHLINMSAGCSTRLNIPPTTFQAWWTYLETHVPDLDLVVVAAAGNSANPWPFWPASFDWAVGVGSLDSDDRVSDFSNWGDSVDVYALGRNVVNAYPNGTYTCHEIPDRGDLRIFNTGLARWSGTSFSAPLVTGLIAREMSGQPNPSAQSARDAVLAVPPTSQVPMQDITTTEVPRVRPSSLAKSIALPWPV